MPQSLRASGFFVIGAFALALALGACRGESDRMPQRPDTLSQSEEARAMEVGAPAATALAGGLVSRLRQAMDGDGVAAALAFCSDEALALTEEIQAEHDPALELKRTTLRWRNPMNAPDPWEERVLGYLQRLERLDPALLPEELAARGPEGSLRYYRVLRADAMCLHCHGAVPSIAADVRQEIRDRYPGDRATGYQAGDVRGVIRVQIPVEPAGG